MMMTTLLTTGGYNSIFVSGWGPPFKSWVFPKIAGFTPQIIHFNRGFPFFSPSNLGYPYFLETPSSFFSSSLVVLVGRG